MPVIAGFGPSSKEGGDSDTFFFFFSYASHGPCYWKLRLFKCFLLYTSQSLFCVISVICNSIDQRGCNFSNPDYKLEQMVFSSAAREQTISHGMQNRTQYAPPHSLSYESVAGSLMRLDSCYFAFWDQRYPYHTLQEPLQIKPDLNGDGMSTAVWSQMVNPLLFSARSPFLTTCTKIMRNTLWWNASLKGLDWLFDTVECNLITINHFSKHCTHHNVSGRDHTTGVLGCLIPFCPFRQSEEKSGLGARSVPKFGSDYMVMWAGVKIHS